MQRFGNSVFTIPDLQKHVIYFFWSFKVCKIIVFLTYILTEESVATEFYTLKNGRQKMKGLGKVDISSPNDLHLPWKLSSHPDATLENC